MEYWLTLKMVVLLSTKIYQMLKRCDFCCFVIVGILNLQGFL